MAGIPEAVTHEQTGLLVSEKDDEALFQALHRLTSAPDFFAACGEAAARSVREEFSQERAIQKLEDFYDEARGLTSAA